METKSKAAPAIKPFIISREFDAPRELVWRAWTESEHLAKWWGPKGSKVGSSKMDLRPGGTHHYSFRFADMDMWGKQYYREVTKPERLVFVNTFSDERGGITRHPLSPSWPAELLTTITFVESGGRTTVTVEWIPIDASQEELNTFDQGRASMKQGWSGSFDQLDTYLASEHTGKGAHS